jgi:hypothetical protein
VFSAIIDSELAEFFEAAASQAKDRVKVVANSDRTTFLAA